MNSQEGIAAIEDPIYKLNRDYLLNFTIDAARRIEVMRMADALDALEDQPPHVLARVFERLAPGTADSLLKKLPEVASSQLLVNVDIRTGTALLSRCPSELRERLLGTLDKGVSKEYRSLLQYPENSAGALMQPRVVAINQDVTVDAAIRQIKQRKVSSLHHLLLLDDEMRLAGTVDIQRIALADGHETLASLSLPVKTVVEPLDPREDVVAKLEKFRVDAIPVVDIDHRLIGVIEGQNLIDALRENLASDMQTMVGASKDERALSSSFFSVRKRHPWLQINLLTAFLAAAVVGAFEGIITKYTALAILLPIAAGQSGNAGAQALAVTMRGLTLREISMGHWLRVMLKECGSGLLNGVGIAITCSTAIYLWSRSAGLALVMALAMVVSMTIAGVSGALVPILLKRFGLDPAQSSSIVLTTVTDIAGFMSFLGIATLLSGMLNTG
ncbi:magnesium transporter [Pelagicoccus sp. SDUM812002]|uniref:magnesium transporter n=1 Tax=Pelagicoccus sp. SDUM812002 TaxID=3041266 RepID=UPI00280CE467|nr:magnesium transporter [Pelagicoccus sp. SDUM812002]MDQ8184371.1 magnesium transporter [Pelagicoccus sp. SDUM812002]